MGDTSDSLGRRILGYILLALLCAAMFLIPSAWVAARGWPMWLSAVVGALAFPVLPLGWHLWAEHKRKKSATGRKAVLERGDRLWLRLLTVAALAIAPLMLLDRGNAWAGLRHHHDWFLDWGGSDSKAAAPGAAITGDPRMLDYVPADAEAIVWLRSAAALKGGERDKSESDKANDSNDAQEALLAARKSGLVLIFRGGAKKLSKADLEKARASIAKEGFLGKGESVEIRQPQKDILVLVTSGWAPSLERRINGTAAAPAALIARLDGQPADAALLAAVRPGELSRSISMEWASGWIAVRDESIVARAKGHATEGAGDAARGTIRGWLGAVPKRMEGECRESMTEIMKKLEVGGSGDDVTFRGTIGGEKLLSLLLCGLSQAKFSEAK